VQELRRRFGPRLGGATVVVVERSIEVFSLLARTRDLSFLLGTVLFVGDERDRLLHFFDSAAGDRISGYRVVRLRGGYVLHPGYYRQVENDFTRLMEGRLSDLLTRIAFESLWMRNMLDNLPSLAGRSSIEPLAGLLNGFPALVIGAGPSLDRQLHLIQDLSSRIALIAVDTAVGTLHKAGIVPHFIVTLDAQHHSITDFAPLFTDSGTVSANTGESGGSVLVADLTACPRVLALWEGPLCFSQSTFTSPTDTAGPGERNQPAESQAAATELHPMGGLLSSVHPVPALACGGSVATTAVELALYMGADPVLVTGLDLAYTGLRTHAASTPFEVRARLQENRLLPSLTVTVQAVRSRRLRAVPGLDGEMVVSDFVLANYLRWFQSRDGYTNRVLNATAEGALIPGLGRADLADRNAPWHNSGLPPLLSANGLCSMLGRVVPNRGDAHDGPHPGDTPTQSNTESTPSARALSGEEIGRFLSLVERQLENAEEKLRSGTSAEAAAAGSPLLSPSAAVFSAAYTSGHARVELEGLVRFLAGRLERVRARLEGV
jgi:hypothetical protein